MGSKKLWAALDGILCVYKPAELSLSGLKKQIVKKICSEGNDALEWPKLPTLRLPIVEPHERTGALLVVGHKEQPDYMLHPLVSGDAFRPEDIRLEELSYMETTSSGVCVLGVNGGCDELPSIMARSWVNEYRLEGMLGRETNKHEIKGRVTLRADYGHVSRHRMAKLLARVQSQYRRAAFESAEIDLQSEEAFELARKGMPRAQLPGVQLLYNLELDTFNPPYFALHVQSSGETDEFLRCFLHEIGVSLGTTASCVRLQRRSVGPLIADHALLEKQISLQNIVRNIAFCRRLLSNTSANPVLVNEMGGNSMGEEESADKEMIDGLGLNSNREDYDAMRPAWPRNYE